MFSVSSKVLSISLLGKHQKKKSWGYFGLLRAERQDNFPYKNRFLKIEQVEKTLVKVKFLVVFFYKPVFDFNLNVCVRGWRGARGRA